MCANQGPLRVVAKTATDFMTIPQVNSFISNIPLLEIYSKNVYSRKPLPGHYFQLFIKLIYDAALRSIEGRMIKIKDLDLPYLTISLPETKTGWEWCKCSTHAKRKLLSCDLDCKKCKGIGKIRYPQTATISEGLAKEIYGFIQAEDLKPNDYLFESPSFPGNPISYSWIKTAMKEVGKLTEVEIFSTRKKRVLKNVYTHLLRRSKAIQMDQDGASIGMIAQKLRHKDIKTTTTYIKSSIGDLRQWEEDHQMEF